METTKKQIRRLEKKRITIDTKLKVLKSIESGKSIPEITKAFNLNRSTVKSIRDNKEKIIEFSNHMTPSMTAHATYCRNNLIESVERMLRIWTNEQKRCKIPCKASHIKTKAKQLFDSLNSKTCSSDPNLYTFVPTTGWYKGFRRRTSQLHPDDLEDSSEADQYLVRDVIHKSGYSPQQVFIVNSTGLYWKSVPKKSLQSMEEEIPSYESSLDRFTVLLGGNASGDFKLKPMVVYHTDTPKDIQGYSKPHLPVIWKSDSKLQITSRLLKEWFNIHFCPTLEEYCTKNHLEHKAVLVLKNIALPVNCENMAGHVEIVCLPNRKGQTQVPQEVTLFKAYYSRHTFSLLLREMQGNHSPTFNLVWYNFNILKSIDIIGESWDEVEGTTDIISLWKKIWPDYTKRPCAFRKLIVEIVQDIVCMTKLAGLGKFMRSEIEDWFESHEEKLSEQNLRQLQKDTDAKININEPATLRMLNKTHLSEAFTHLEIAMAIFSENDPNRERSATTNSQIINAHNTYMALYQHLKHKSKQ